MKIFISHSSRDQLIVDAFVEKILISGCGIDEKFVFCTSVEGLGIKTGNDFREYILKELYGSEYSFLLISNNYKSSEICLNEMGASWALKGIKVKPFLFPNINFDSIGALYQVKQAVKLNDSFALDELFEEMILKYSVSKSIARWNKSKLEFLEIIETYRRENINFINPSPEDYFSQYIKEDISVNNLILKAHPTLLDCKAVFSQDHFKRMFQRYCDEFEQLSLDYIEPLYPKYKSLRIDKWNVSDTNRKNSFPGGMKKLLDEGKLRSNITFYKVTFLENEFSELGLNYNVFCYVNHRWVFLIKPWW